MTRAIVVVAIVLGALVLLFLLFMSWLNKKRLCARFRANNVIVFGRKGKGKDLIFQEVIRKRGERYRANIDYGYDLVEIVDGRYCNVDPNTYKDFIEGSVQKIEKAPDSEGVDVYFSDAGIMFPSQMDSALHKQFPSFPIYYALSRHLYGNNVHCNTQALGRVWKALREQADYYVRADGIIRLPFFLVARFTTYTKYETACRDEDVVKIRLFNKFSKAETDTMNASRGEVKKGFFFIRKRSIKYDTRYFHRVLFGRRAPKPKPSRLRVLFSRVFKALKPKKRG